MKVPIVLCLAATAVLCGYELLREVSGARIVTIAATGDVAVPAALAAWEARCGSACTVPARLSAEALRASVADHAGDPKALRQAAQRLAGLAAEEPLNANIAVVQTYASSLADREHPSAQTLAALAHSYDTARYSREAANWRLRFSGAVWPDLSPALKARALDEAQWLLTIDPRAQDAVEQAFTAPEAKAALNRRLSAAGAAMRTTT